MIRKTTVLQHFCNSFDKEVKEPEDEKKKTSTKVRFHQLVCSAEHMKNTQQMPDPTLVVRHLCGCSLCCNPSHLKYGTQQQNISDTHFHHVMNALGQAPSLNDTEKNKLIKQVLTSVNSDLL